MKAPENDQPAPRVKVETVIIDEDIESLLAVIDGPLWPPIDTALELGEPNRTANVCEVRLRLLPDTLEVRIMVKVVEGGV